MKTQLNTIEKTAAEIAILKQELEALNKKERCIKKTFLAFLLFSCILFLVSSCRSSYTCPTYAKTSAFKGAYNPTNTHKN